MLNKTLKKITGQIEKRSERQRSVYLKRMKEASQQEVSRITLPCSNLAHGFASCSGKIKHDLKSDDKPNLAIVSAYNDMLSAHQPYERFPAIIKDAAVKAGAVAQFAGGVPAMCDGVTQGQTGMELSLLSRDTIAMGTAIALSHNMFDGALLLGICDKIVPGLLIGALSFAHLPVVFVPGGPMPSGISNKEKARMRELYAEKKISKSEMLEVEAKSYHSPGTCTFYGTANSNQMLMEIMGLQLPGSFINPNTPLRDALTREATKTLIKNTRQAGKYLPLYEVINEKSIVNAIVGLLATAGSTNHTIHLIAVARAAGIKVTWDDFAELSKVVPLLARVYPNGEADVNHFRDAGGMGFVIGQLLNSGLLHNDVATILGKGLDRYMVEPKLKGSSVLWKSAENKSSDDSILRSAKSPFKKDSGLKLLKGNIGRAIIKTSSLKPENYRVEAPAKVFTNQKDLISAFEKGKLHQDFIAVLKFQGPKANGMPELHKLTSPLGVLQNLGYKVGLVTDGRMSGASAKIPAAIHVTPEGAIGGNIAKIKDGDIITIDSAKNILEVKVSSRVFSKRKPSKPDLSQNQAGMGREIFASMRDNISSAEEGASFL